MKVRRKYFLAILPALFLFFAFTASADTTGDIRSFNIEKSFDTSARQQTESILVYVAPKIYFYIEKSWWDTQNPAQRNEVYANLSSLSAEFEQKIYPTLTSVFGQEWNPGVDGDSRITVLFLPMHNNEGGYFRTMDEYIKLQLPDSNEREMVFLSIDNITGPQLKVLLAHEFMHLIIFNQKNRLMGAEDDTWLDEARADYSSTILGYDDKYESSNLQQRVKDFITNPSDSVTEWTGTKYDYASASLFSHYLLDHYGINIFIDSLKSEHTGIDSINYALKKNGYEDDFAKIFADWIIASYINNCNLNQNYCYLNQNLKNFRLPPFLNFLPVTGNVSLSVSNVTKSWSGNWIKFIGGNGDLKLSFSSLKGLVFAVPYIIEDSAGSYSVKFLALDKSQQGQISINKFGTDYKSLVIMPVLETQIYKTDGVGPTYPFTYKVEVTGSGNVGGEDIIQQLLDKIAELKEEIARLQGKTSDSVSCNQLNSNLSFGMSGEGVKCLQNFLKLQGAGIYPEGYVTGYFGQMTKSAVIRFQEKYRAEILAPLGLGAGTGFVGALTKMKINQILNVR